MLRRARLRAALVAFVLLALSFSSVRAKQIYDEQNARSALNAAQRAYFVSLSGARAEGLTAQDLRQITRTARKLSARRAPAASPIWNSTSAAYYRSQTRGYRLLRSALRTTQERVTARTRANATQMLSSTQAVIGQARALGISMDQASSALERESALLSGASTPVAYRAVASRLQAENVTLRQSVAAQKARLEAIVQRSGGSVQGVAALAASREASVQSQLNLISLLSPRAAADETLLRQAVRSVADQRDPLRAAVQESRVEGLAAQVLQLYRTTIPERMIVVSTETQSATMYQSGRQIYSTLVTTGGPELPTDHGVFHIYEKITPFVFHSPWPPDSPYYYAPTPITYWMPFDGGEGLHDAWWRSNYGPGSNLAPTDLGGGRTILGTHGCVNLPYDAAHFVWNWAPVGTPVIVD